MVDKGLPPGLWLPTAEEPTDKFLIETFNRSDHPYEEVVELGMFAVALASFDEKRLAEGTLMPSRMDIVDLYNEGFGINANRLHQRYGGFARLQQALGYYPRGYKPERAELIERLTWFGLHYLPSDDSFNGSRGNAEEVLEWGARRRLLPSLAITNDVLKDNSLLKKSLGLEKPNCKEMYTVMDAYRLAARIIRECGGPITQLQLNERYGKEFEVLPNQIVQTHCGSLGALWLEFGYVADTKTLSADDLIDIGVRHAIRVGNPRISIGEIDELSAAKMFPSRMPIRSKFFGSTSLYRQKVENRYQNYLAMQRKLQTLGVSTTVCKIASQRYKSGPEFKANLVNNVEALVQLSAQNDSARYAHSIISRGFDIENQEAMEIQLKDFKKALKSLGIEKQSEYRFIFGLIPHVSFDHVNF